jgi:hypothetical protein
MFLEPRVGKREGELAENRSNFDRTSDGVTGDDQQTRSGECKIFQVCTDRNLSLKKNKSVLLSVNS